MVFKRRSHLEQMTGRVGVSVVAAVGALLLAGVAWAAQGGAVSVPLFSGRLGGDTNVRLGSWGSGRAEEARDRAFVGDTAIKITTQGMYQGARIDFNNAVDLAPAFANPNTYLRMQVRFSGAGSSQGSFDPSSQQTTTVAKAPFNRMRFLMTMADGSQYELVRPIDLPPSEDPDSYVPLAFPLSAVTKGAGSAAKAPSGEGAKVKSLAIFGDKYQQFYVGEMGIITDETEITLEPVEEQIAFVNDTMTFVGAAEGGATTLKYSWDFDAADGIQEDAVGRVVNHTYRNGGKKTVTLTVSDVDGLKKPQTKSVEMDVNE